MKFISLAFLFLLAPATYAQTVGVLYNDQAAFEGYTLFTSNSDHDSYLIDNCGQLVHTWANDTQAGLMAYLTEEGDLLRTTRIIQGPFSGGGLGGLLECYDWDGNLLWDFRIADSRQQQHHDIALLPNGNILVLVYEYFLNDEALDVGRNPFYGTNPVWSEKIVEIEPIGTDSAKVVWEWRVWDHLVQAYDQNLDNYGVVADHPERIDINFIPNPGNSSNVSSDWLHANAIDYNEELDQIVFNCRNFGEFWIIDHSTTKAEAASSSGGNQGKGGDLLYRWGNPLAYQRGSSFDQQLYLQHDATWIPAGLPDAGKIMVFNNGTGRLGQDYSTVDVIVPPKTNGVYDDPGTGAYGPTYPEWTYPEVPDYDFFAKNISGAQRLPNGNTLICEGPSGHFFEVSETGDLHWEYINPISLTGPVPQGSNPVGNEVFRALRYAPDYPAFDGRDMTPGEVIELNGTPYCFEPNTIKEKWGRDIFFPTRVTSGVMPVVNPSGGFLRITVFDMLGKPVFDQSSSDTHVHLPLENLPVGIYVIRFTDRRNERFIAKKFVKQ